MRTLDWWSFLRFPKDFYMNTEKLKGLQIAPEEKSRPQGAVWSIVIVVIIVLLGAVAFIKPWAKDKREITDNTAGNSVSTNAATARSVSETSAQKNSLAAPSDSVLTVSGYIINRERIEIS